MKIKLHKIQNIFFILLQLNVPIPFDKLLIIPYIMFLSFLKKIKFTRIERLILGILCVIASISFIINYPQSSIQIYYPIIFLAASILAARSNINILIVRKILAVNIIIGLIAVIASYLGYENNFAFSHAQKMLPYLYGPLGLSPTQQVYGTFCILLQLISFEYKKYDWLFFISILCLILTLNRCSILFFAILIFIYKRNYFYSLCIIGITLILYYWEVISNIMFSTATLDSRGDLRKGAEISFWKSNDIIIYLFGRGNTNTTEAIAARTYWERTYIEHGLDFIFHCYGYIGFSIIALLMIVFIGNLLRKKSIGYALICIYYLMIEPLFTHEFIASSFFYFMFIILYLSNKKQPEFYKE